MFRSNRKLAAFLLAALCAGVFVAVAFPGVVTRNEGFGYCLPIAFVPLLVAIELLPLPSASSSRPYAKFLKVTPFRRGIAAALLAWLTGIVVSLGAFFWMPIPLVNAANLNYPSSYGLFFLYALLAGLYFPLLLSPFILDAVRTARKSAHAHRLPVWALAMVCVCIERWFPRWMPWKLGDLMHFSNEINQWSSLFGSSFVSFLILWGSAWLAKSVTSYPRVVMRAFASALAVSAVWVVVFFVGYWRLQMLERRVSAYKLSRIGFVQPNFHADERVNHRSTPGHPSAKMIEDVLAESKSLIEKSGDQKLQLLVWPKAVVPDDFTLSAGELAKVHAFAKQTGVSLLIPANEYPAREIHESNPPSLSEAPAFSSSFLIRPDGSRSASVQQWSFLPFTERAPFANVFPNFAQNFQSFFHLRTWHLGQKAEGLSYASDFDVGPLISFDVAELEKVRKMANAGGAGVLVAQANLAWMGNLRTPGLEFKELARRRALENVRSLLVVSNSGPSTAFDPLGREVMKPTSVMKRDMGILELPVPDDEALFESFYSQFTDVPLAIIGVIAAFQIVLAAVRKPR